MRVRRLIITVMIQLDAPSAMKHFDEKSERY